MLGLDWRKGTTLWSFADPDRQFPFLSSAALTPRSVIIGGRDKRIRALDIRTGKQLWVFPTQARVDSSAVIVGDRAYVGASDGNVYALQVDTGRQVWRFEAGGAITASPAVSAGRLVIGTLDGRLYCFGSDATPDPKVKTQVDE